MGCLIFIKKGLENECESCYPHFSRRRVRRVNDRSSLSVTEEDPEPLQLPWGQKQSGGLSDIGISGIKSGCSLLMFRHTCP